MTEVITSLQNTTIKKIAALDAKKQRDKLGLFVAEGIRLVEEAAASAWTIDCAVYTEKLTEQPRGAALLAALEQRAVKMLCVSDSVYQKIGRTETAQGILAVVAKNERLLADWRTADCRAIAVLDAVQDPGNVGAIIRTAAADCAAVVLLPGCADPFADKAVRAAMGALFKIPVFEGVEPDELVAYCRQSDRLLVTTCLEGSVSYESVDYTRSSAIVFGNEGNGVQSALIQKSDARIRIPLHHDVESLNVAAAAAVVLYEALRQRKSTVHL